MTDSRIKDETFYLVQGWMINRLGLKGVPLSVYAIIYGFSQDGETEFTGSLQYLCDFTGGTSKPTIIKALRGLVDQGYILKKEEVINGVQFNRYKVNLSVVKNINGGGKETLPGVVKNFNGGSKEFLPNNIKDNIGLKDKEIYINIVSYLNQKAKKAYKPTNKSTQRYIDARLSDGFTVEDFKRVIDNKCSEWLGGQMEKYLRPETLFGNKFESYLNSRSAANEQKKDNDDLDGIL